MKEILDFLAECKMFFLATDDKGQPRVRPMGLALEYKGKLCFGTNNKKKMFAQIKANPRIEISASNGNRWLRVTGKAALIADRDAKVKALEAMPALKKMYSPDDGLFEIFRLDDATAVFADMSGNTKEVRL
jgi:uncharacterized pyridoxamine 5'-phosphate oxidase family protein